MRNTKSSPKIPTHYLVFYKTISKESTPKGFNWKGLEIIGKNVIKKDGMEGI